MLRHFFEETQVTLILAPIVCAVYGLLFAFVYQNGVLFLFGLLLALLYVASHFISLQQQYEKMLRVMPIDARHLARMYCHYLLVISLIYTALFGFVYLLFNALRGQFSISQLYVICACLSVVLLAIPLFFIAYYTLPKVVHYVIALLLLASYLAGQKPFFKLTEAFAPDMTASSLLLLVVAAPGYYILCRVAEQLYATKNVTEG